MKLMKVFREVSFGLVEDALHLLPHFLGHQVVLPVLGGRQQHPLELVDVLVHIHRHKTPALLIQLTSNEFFGTDKSMTKFRSNSSGAPTLRPSFHRKISQHISFLLKFRFLLFTLYGICGSSSFIMALSSIWQSLFYQVPP